MVYVNKIVKAPINRIEVVSTGKSVEQPKSEKVADNEREQVKRGRKPKNAE